MVQLKDLKSLQNLSILRGWSWIRTTLEIPERKEAIHLRAKEVIILIQWIQSILIHRIIKWQTTRTRGVHLQKNTKIGKLIRAMSHEISWLIRERVVLKGTKRIEAAKDLGVAKLNTDQETKEISKIQCTARNLSVQKVCKIVDLTLVLRSEIQILQSTQYQ